MGQNKFCYKLWSLLPGWQNILQFPKSIFVDSEIRLLSFTWYECMEVSSHKWTHYWMSVKIQSNWHHHFSILCKLLSDWTSYIPKKLNYLKIEVIYLSFQSLSRSVPHTCFHGCTWWHLPSTHDICRKGYKSF